MSPLDRRESRYGAKGAELLIIPSVGCRSSATALELDKKFVEGMALNEIPASSVAAIEVYPQGAFAPTQYSVRGSCGVIVVWTKQSRRIPGPPPAGERNSGAGVSPSP